MSFAVGTPPRCFALVPCAGAGARAGHAAPKQYASLAGRTVIEHTLTALAKVQRVEATLVVIAPGDARFAQHAGHLLGERCWVEAIGGDTRARSVAAGLVALAARGAAPHDWVLVHDAARCLVRPEWIDRLIDACIDDPVGGLLALELADTLKASHEGRAVSTIPRDGRYLAQTPQMYRLALLREGLACAGSGVTDEASAIESLGRSSRLVRGDPRNIKLTWPQDFELAREWLGAQGSACA